MLLSVMESTAVGRWQVRAAVAAMTLLWGTTWGAIRVGLQGVPPLTGIALRFLLASVLLAVLARATRQRWPRDRQFWLVCLVNGLLLFTISYAVVYWSEQWVPSGLGAVIFSTYPLLVMLLAHWVLPAEPLSRGRVLGALIGFAGIAVVFSEDLGSLLGREAATGAVLLLLSPLVSAIAAVVVKRWGHGYPPLCLTIASMLVGTIATGLLAWSFERARPIVWSTASVAALLYLAVFGSAITFGLYFWLLARYPARSMALIAYGTPIVALALGAWLWNEPLTPRMMIGTALVVIGIAGALRGRG